MKAAHIFFVAMLILIIASCSSPYKSDQAIRMDQKIVSDSSSSIHDFEVSANRIDGAKIDESFWLQLGSDGTDPDRRRKCLKHFFSRLMDRPLYLGQLVNSIGTRANWLSYTNITELPHVISSPLPHYKLVKNTSSIFMIPILADRPGDYWLQVYVALGQTVDLEDFQKALSGRPVSESVKRIQIVWMTTWDSEDQIKQYPGLNPNNPPWTAVH